MRPRAPARGLALLCLLALVPVRSARITRAGGARKVINDASNNRVLRPAGHMLTGVSTDPDLVTMLGDSYDSDRESYDPDVDDDGDLLGDPDVVDEVTKLSKTTRKKIRDKAKEKRERYGPKGCLVAMWLGEFPAWMRLYLASASANMEWEFLIVSDQEEPDNVPDNVSFKYMSEKDMRQKAEAKTGLMVGGGDAGGGKRLDDPVKLSDYKPLIGKMFAKRLQYCKYWGWTDLDVVYGDLSKFVRKRNNQGATPKPPKLDVIVSGASTSHTGVSSPLCVFRNNKLTRNLYSKLGDEMESQLADPAYNHLDKQLLGYIQDHTDTVRSDFEEREASSGPVQFEAGVLTDSDGQSIMFYHLYQEEARLVATKLCDMPLLKKGSFYIRVTIDVTREQRAAEQESQNEQQRQQNEQERQQNDQERARLEEDRRKKEEDAQQAMQSDGEHDEDARKRRDEERDRNGEDADRKKGQDQDREDKEEEERKKREKEKEDAEPKPVACSVNQQLSGASFYSTVAASSVDDCSTACSEDPKCTGAQYREGGQCQLTDSPNPDSTAAQPADGKTHACTKALD